MQVCAELDVLYAFARDEMEIRFDQRPRRPWFAIGYAVAASLSFFHWSMESSRRTIADGHGERLCFIYSVSINKEDEKELYCHQTFHQIITMEMLFNTARAIVRSLLSAKGTYRCRHRLYCPERSFVIWHQHQTKRKRSIDCGVGGRQKD